MDTGETAESDIRPGEIELVSDDDGGVICFGGPADVEAYISQLTVLAVEHGQEPAVSVTTVKKAGALAATGANLRATSGTYFKLTGDSEELLRKYVAMPGRTQPNSGSAAASPHTPRWCHPWRGSSGRRDDQGPAAV